jgi:hypothetical protein
MSTIYELSLPELEELLAMSPANSACARAGIEQLKNIIAAKKEQLNTQPTLEL